MNIVSGEALGWGNLFAVYWDREWSHAVAAAWLSVMQASLCHQTGQGFYWLPLLSCHLDSHPAQRILVCDHVGVRNGHRAGVREGQGSTILNLSEYGCQQAEAKLSRQKNNEQTNK